MHKMVMRLDEILEEKSNILVLLEILKKKSTLFVCNKGSCLLIIDWFLQKCFVLDLIVMALY